MARAWAVMLCLAMAGSAAAEPEPTDIARRTFDVDKVVDSRAEITMALLSQSGARRERSTITLSKLLPNGIDRQRLIRFTAPAEVKGTATLLVEHAAGDDDIWIYLPALRKVRRLVANNKKDSFVGTDFSYGDIIGHRVEGWAYRLAGRESVAGAETYVLEATPRSDAIRDTSGYAKRKLWVRTDNYVTVKAAYWDTAGALLKEFEASDVREIDPKNAKWQAFHLTMHNRQTGHRTDLVFTKLEVGVGLRDEEFSERYLDKEL
ncbi:MAG: outer membrane lipoprotein-sorting protein [Deltaproteobacteria bacterium]|nr:outer membrane lipoprotein-sorting protein [Deltaproteobacteria bacterium]